MSGPGLGLSGQEKKDNMPIEKIAASIRQMPRWGKRLVVISTDALLCAAAVALALMLRTERWDVLRLPYLPSLLGALLLFLPVFYAVGVYREVFRAGSGTTVSRAAKATLLYGAVYALVFTMVGIAGVPRTVGVLQPVMFFVLVAASRLLARYWLGGIYRDAHLRKQWPRVLIYGAGEAGQQLASALENGRKVWLMGFVDDDARLHGSTLHGVPVLPSADLDKWLSKLRINDVLLALPSASRRRRSEIVDTIRAIDPEVVVRTLPAVTDIAQGRVQVSQLHDVDVTDLLGRDPIPPNAQLLGRNIAGKVVVVTGAGGSIGSELCRQILVARPATLLLVEVSEFALYDIHRELSGVAEQEGIDTMLLPLLGSVRDLERMRKIFTTWRPDTVYHAAAYKHVPMVEHNPAEGIANNVFGTLRTAQLAVESGVTDFVLISTDKAVRPTNVMGASKRLAELCLQALANDAAASRITRFSMVRFGNVLGSSGSVVPLFREQIRKGAPITLTHKDITRYFMTIPEAAQLVIQAGAMAEGGDVFVLDMGQPVKIIDLARRMIELSGLTVQDEDNPDGDIAIEVTGLRPGEKLYEELLIGDNPQPTAHERIMKAHEDYLPWSYLREQLDAMAEAVRSNDVQAMRTLLKALVSGYRPASDVVDWLHMEQDSQMQSLGTDTGTLGRTVARAPAQPPLPGAERLRVI